MSEARRIHPAALGGAVAIAICAPVGLGMLAASLLPEAPQPAPTHTVTVEVPAAVDTRTCRDVAAALHDMLTATSDEVDITVYLDALDHDYQRCINP